MTITMKDSVERVTTTQTTSATFVESAVTRLVGVRTEQICPICGGDVLAILKCKTICLACHSLVENCNGD